MLSVLVSSMLWKIPSSISSNKAMDPFEENQTQVVIQSEKNLRQVLSTNFLYLTQKLLKEQWNQKTILDKCHSVRVLHFIISILEEADIKTFLAKVSWSVFHFMSARYLIYD